MAAHMSLRHLYPQILTISRVPCCLCARRQQTAVQELKKTDLQVTQSAGGEEIVIPKRKKRDSLSILKALSSTVKNDPLGPRYTFIDDPRFIPRSRGDQIREGFECKGVSDTGGEIAQTRRILQEQLFAVSKASGRRAARRMMQEFPEAFDHDDAAPHIKAFEPEVVYYQHQKPDEEALIERIHLRRVEHAIEVHKKMEKLGVKASQAVLESLLELVCVYNHKDPVPCDPEELDNEFKQSVGPWQVNGYAERMFDSLPEKTANAYNSLIRGMSMHKFSKQAIKLYKEMKSKDLPVYKETYLEMIKGARSFVNSQRTRKSTENEVYEIYWKYVGDLLKDMKNSKIPPCVETYNAVLRGMNECELRINGLVDKVLNEMTALGIEPTLATWKGVVMGCRLPKQAYRRCIENIFIQLNGKQLEIKTADDYAFFQDTMQQVGVYELNNAKLAMDLAELKESLGADAAIPHYQNNNFYKTFFRTVTGRVPVEDLMKEYSKVAPFRFTPDRNIFRDIIEDLRVHEAHEYLPQIWEDINMIMPRDIVHIMEPLFQDLARKKYDEKNQTEFLKMADQLFDRWKMMVEDEIAAKRFGTLLNGKVMGYLIKIALNSDDLDKAWEFFSGYKAALKTIRDHPDEDAYKALFDACFLSRDPEKFMTLINFMNAQDLYFVNQFIQDAKATLDSTADDSQRSMLESL